MACAAPPLRRSKRKLAEKTTELTPQTSIEPALAPRKRTRTAPKATIKSTFKTSPIPKPQIEDPPTDPTPPPEPTQPPQPLPPFLALPRELRDEIYKHVLDQDGSTTLKAGSRNTATRSGLVGVNSQICEEFLDAVLLYAPVISTTVRNHNFAHVVTFLNRLSQAQLARLAARRPHAADLDRHARATRKIKITLSYTAGAKDSRAHLNRWLDRFDVPDKRGKEIEFEYDCDGTYQNGGYKQRPKRRETASARWNEEASKIRKAAARGGRARGGWSYY
ncbi:hypothetical protein BU23DRAFT_602603 [Bimuria novae-zelandiae CBS 107.79]|uniref:Uncharacterized protein n=1 Tax=Bimuria novae-zelandiae CBS 107.79 TaxID=1447943 RepID=A0A6A5UT57_9PLEO|nr:hypothetical protein BU23DRAFT_602603 [Bimuria novae-zelandiae CBS 107.79]